MRCVIVVSILIMACSARGADILAGSSLPEDQGWTRMTNIVSPLNVSTDGTDLRVNTWGAISSTAPQTGPFLLWQYPLAPISRGFAIDFTLDWQMQVYRSAYNSYDGGVVMMGSYTPGGFAGTADERSQALMFMVDRICWGDLSASYFMNTSDTLHDYRLVIDESGGHFYADGVLALDRSSFAASGYIGFGDQTNDIGVDGDFRIRGISASDLVFRPVPFPTPGAILLSTFGAGLVSWLRRRRVL